MTAARPQRKRYQTVLASFLLFGVLVADPAGSRGGTTERIVTDWHTGLAIGGYDPVAFYTDRKPILGAADVELAYGGAVWRFTNIGNREAFAAHPDVYMPQFGGYDPVGVARGVAVPGNPEIWTIIGDSLFLFRDQSRLRTFLTDPERFTGAAERRWPDVLRALTP
jgi:hypothetical protein